MRQIRLNGESRSMLHRLARKLVEAPDLRETAKQAYTIAAKEVRRVVEERLPPADMAVFRKYDRAKVDDCIRLQLTYGGVVVFEFHRGEGPLAISCMVFLADEAATDAYTAWNLAHKAHKEALEKKLKDYDSLIAASRTLEQVSAVWPEAEQLREQLSENAVLVFSPDIVNRIRADVERRAAQAA